VSLAPLRPLTSAPPEFQCKGSALGRQHLLYRANRTHRSTVIPCCGDRPRAGSPDSAPSQHLQLEGCTRAPTGRQAGKRPPLYRQLIRRRLQPPHSFTRLSRLPLNLGEHISSLPSLLYTYDSLLRTVTPLNRHPFPRPSPFRGFASPTATRPTLA
jgi:hypothetical protein